MSKINIEKPTNEVKNFNGVDELRQLLGQYFGYKPNDQTQAIGKIEGVVTGPLNINIHCNGQVMKKPNGELEAVPDDTSSAVCRVIKFDKLGGTIEPTSSKEAEVNLGVRAEIPGIGKTDLHADVIVSKNATTGEISGHSHFSLFSFNSDVTVSIPKEEKTPVLSEEKLKEDSSISNKDLPSEPRSPFFNFS